MEPLILWCSVTSGEAVLRERTMGGGRSVWENERAGEEEE